MKNLNNKGVSLIELLIAIAVGAIVLSALTLLVTQATKGYRVQVETAQIQNEANITLNQIESAVMEAKEITVENEKAPNGTEIAGGNTRYLVLSDNMVYIYDSTKETLYLADKKYTSQSDLDTKASIVCVDVTEFKVKIKKESFKTKDDGTGRQVINKIDNPVRMEITVNVKKNSRERTVSRISGVRNMLNLSDIQLGVHQLKTGNVSLSDIDSYVVK